MNVDGRQGLVVRLHPSGVISFRIRYTCWNPVKRARTRQWLVLGEFGDNGISLAQAFEMHAQAQRELELKLDPAEERRKRLEAERRVQEEHAGAGTIADLVQQFVHRKLRAERWDNAQKAWVRDTKNKTKARKRPDAAAALLGYIDKATTRQKKRKGAPKATLLSEYGKVNARDLTKRQLIALLDGIVDRGAPVSANRTHALLKQMFDWAAAKDILPASPMAGIERPGGDESPRQRVMTADEIKVFWSAIDSADMAGPTQLALKLLLITGQRRGELTFAKWSHFDLDAKLWTVPVELLKSSHARRTKPEPHLVPLSSLAVQILLELQVITGRGAFVLPAHVDHRKDRSYSERVLSRAVRENEDHFGIEHFTPHDLRRTAASFMTKLGVPRLHVEKVLNHSTGDIAEVYDRHDYLTEKRVALDTWGKHLQQLVGAGVSEAKFEVDKNSIAVEAAA